MVAPTFPNVPMAPGVPPVARDASAATSTDEPRLTRDSDAVDRLAATQWGIFGEGGENVLAPDNITAVGNSAEYRVSDYPIAKGGFESYNKVALPFQSRVTMTKGGKLSERQNFLYRVEAIKGDLKLYNVVTPERVYIGVNVERVSLDRNATNGAGMVSVEIVLREIRQTASVAFTRSQTPAGAERVNEGSVQTVSSDQSGADVR